MIIRGFFSIIRLASAILSYASRRVLPKIGSSVFELSAGRLIAISNEIVVFGRAGNEESLISYGKIKNLIDKDFGDPPFVLIIPGKLHFTEKEYLEYHRAD